MKPAVRITPELVADAAPAPPATPLGYALPAGFGSPQGWHTLPAMQPALVAVYHVFTLGLSSLIHYPLLHGRLPRNRRGDPTAARALGLMFVPVLNLWWVWFVNLRLLTRIDEQRRLAGLPERPLKALCVSMLVMLMIPYVNVFAWLFVCPLYYASLQAGINELCLATDAVRRPAPAPES